MGGVEKLHFRLVDVCSTKLRDILSCNGGIMLEEETKDAILFSKNLEYPNRKASAIFGSVGREALKLERGVTSSVFQGSSLTEGNSTWRQSITSFAKMRIAFALSFASSSPGTLKVIRVREGPRMLVPATVASSSSMSV